MTKHQFTYFSYKGNHSNGTDSVSLNAPVTAEEASAIMMLAAEEPSRKIRVKLESKDSFGNRYTIKCTDSDIAEAKRLYL